MRTNPKKEKEDGKLNEKEEEKGNAMVVEAADPKRKKKARLLRGEIGLQ